MARTLAIIIIRRPQLSLIDSHNVRVKVRSLEDGPHKGVQRRSQQPAQRSKQDQRSLGRVPNVRGGGTISARRRRHSKNPPKKYKGFTNNSAGGGGIDNERCGGDEETGGERMEGGVIHVLDTLFYRYIVGRPAPGDAATFPQDPLPLPIVIFSLFCAKGWLKKLRFLLYVPYHPQSSRGGREVAFVSCNGVHHPFGQMTIKTSRQPEGGDNDNTCFRANTDRLSLRHCCMFLLLILSTATLAWERQITVWVCQRESTANGWLPSSTQHQRHQAYRNRDYRTVKYSARYRDIPDISCSKEHTRHGRRYY